jgi:purine nucleoside permease
MGDELSSSTYWHGDRFDAWAEAWVRYFSGGQGEFATAAMEDTGTLQSLQFLSRAGRVDWQRILVLRTVSNYDRQPRGLSAAQSLEVQRAGTAGAYLPAIESAYTVGHVVVSELLAHWQRYRSAVIRAVRL